MLVLLLLVFPLVLYQRHFQTELLLFAGDFKINSIMCSFQLLPQLLLGLLEYVLLLFLVSLLDL